MDLLDPEEGLEEELPNLDPDERARELDDDDVRLLGARDADREEDRTLEFAEDRELARGTGDP